MFLFGCVSNFDISTNLWEATALRIALSKHKIQTRYYSIDGSIKLKSRMSRELITKKSFGGICKNNKRCKKPQRYQRIEDIDLSSFNNTFFSAEI
jgi:hypothetical protein